jgi:hypothetical protein
MKRSVKVTVIFDLPNDDQMAIGDADPNRLESLVVDGITENIENKLKDRWGHSMAHYVEIRSTVK